MKIVQNKNSKEPCKVCGELFRDGELKVAELVMSGPYNRIKRTYFYHVHCLKEKYAKDIRDIERMIKEKKKELLKVNSQLSESQYELSNKRKGL